MAQIDRLRRETKRLNRQIRDLELQMEKQKNAFGQEVQKKMDEYDRIHKQQVYAITQQQKQQFESRLAELKQQIERKMAKEQQELVKRYQILQQELKNVRREAQRFEEELQNRIEGLHRQQILQEETEEKEAVRYLEEAEEEMKRVAAMPCEKFFPGKIALFQQNLRDAWQMMRQGIRQAAAATAVSVKAALERFSYDVEDEQKAWEKQYREILRQTAVLQEELKKWEREFWMPEEEKSAVSADMNYWTRGWYETAENFLERMENMQAQIDQAGMQEYLKEKESADFEVLQQLSEEVKQLSEQCHVFKIFYRTSQQASIQRDECLQTLIGTMVKERGYQCEGGRYRVQPACSKLLEERYFQDYNKEILENENNTLDYQGWYQADFYGMGGIRIEVAFLPIVRDYVVKNRVCYHIYQGEEDCDQKQLIESIGVLLREITGNKCLGIETTNDKKKKEAMIISQDQIVREWVRTRTERMES